MTPKQPGHLTLEIIDNVESLMDDAAAVGNPGILEKLQTRLEALTKAVERRREGIEYRLSGLIQHATEREESSEQLVQRAREI